jgi:hypothetical protein
MALQSMELALIGAGVGGGIKHTTELKVIDYKKSHEKLRCRRMAQRNS